MTPPHWLVLAAGALAGGYLVGCIPVAWLVVRRQQGVDLRRTGRGQAGALDALVVGGIRTAGLTVVLELCKGAVVGLGARIYDPNAWFAATAIAGCVVGDAFPVGMRRPRRGVAPLVAGVIAALPSAWWAGLIIAVPGVVLLGLRGRAFEQLVILCVPIGLLVGTRDVRTLAPAAIIVAALIARHQLRALHQRREAGRWTELGNSGTPLVVEFPARADASGGAMSGGLSGYVTGVIENHGTVALFLLTAAESCGVPFPSEVIMPVAGAVAAGALVGGAHLGLVPAILAGASGELLGSLLAWLIAARFGEPILLGPGRYIGISRSHIELADRFFARFGLIAVLVGRLLPVIRTYVSFPAGLARVPVVPFALLTFAGSLLWCSALGIAGYEVGANYDRISGPIQKIAIVLALLLVVGVVAWFLRGRRRAVKA